MSKIWTAPDIEERAEIVAQLHKGGAGNGSGIDGNPCPWL